MPKRPSLWRRLLFGVEDPPPAPPAPAAEPPHLGSADEAFLARLVADLADGKRRNEIGDADVLRCVDGLWTSGHERLAIEWMEKLLSVPEVPGPATAALRAAQIELLTSSKWNAPFYWAPFVLMGEWGQ